MIGCLCIHGFTGSPYEVAPLVDYLQEKTDWHVVAPTLPGHGEELQLKGVSHQLWIEHAEKELKKLIKTCEEIYIIGFSMGGLIASLLVTKYQIDKLVLLSAAAYYVNPRQLLLDIKNMIRDSFKGNLRSNELFQRYKRKIVDTPLRATVEFRKIVSLARRSLQYIRIPTFIAQGENDGIVPAKSAKYLYNNIGTDKKVLYMEPEAKHHICYANNRNVLFKKILAFLQSEEKKNDDQCVEIHT